ncbi:MAG: ABC transporter ATP-binding protein [Lentisphaeria bacterium]|nr:ABC transporter ATP-binding protein [Lentisphaeria bacterium]
MPGAPSQIPAAPAVACYGLMKHYPGRPALTGIDLELPRGQIIGLLGPNGSGKTTLVKILAGLLRPSAGTVLIDGLEPGADTKSFVSYLPERTYFNPSMRVSDCVKMFADFYDDFDLQRALGMLAALGVPYRARLKTLSKGTREKVQLVLVMARRAKLYLLDEPIGGVDPAAREYILNTIIANRDPESTVLLSTHLIRDVEDILDGFVFLGDGQVIAGGDAHEARARHGMSLDELFREVFRCF